MLSPSCYEQAISSFNGGIRRWHVFFALRENQDLAQGQLGPSFEIFPAGRLGDRHRLFKLLASDGEIAVRRLRARFEQHEIRRARGASLTRRGEGSLARRDEAGEVLKITALNGTLTSFEDKINGPHRAPFEDRAALSKLE